MCSKSKSQGCEWFVHAVLRRSDGSFFIKKFVNEHKCMGRIMGKRSKMLRSKLLASVIGEKVQSVADDSVKEIVKNMKREYGVNVPYLNAWYAKEMA